MLQGNRFVVLPSLQVIVAPSSPPLLLLLPALVVVVGVVCSAIIYDYWQTMETIRHSNTRKHVSLGTWPPVARVQFNLISILIEKYSNSLSVCPSARLLVCPTACPSVCLSVGLV